MGNETFLNILPIHSYTLIDCKLNILTEYQESGSLARRVHEQTELGSKGQPAFFGEELIHKWILEISNGLIFLHSRGIVHGNLKCENILFDQNDFIKLVDFGVAPNLVTEQAAASINLYDYAPEHRTFNSVTFKSDIYMLGTCLYRCVTLKPMTKEINPELILSKKLVSSANLLLNAKLNSLNSKRTKSAVNLKLKIFGHHYSDLLKRNILGNCLYSV